MNEPRAQALIVDDEADIRDLVGMALSRIGIETTAAATLEEARSLLARHSFDFCLTDMRLPDGSGIELVRSATRQYPDMPIAVITAYGNAEAAVDSLKAGAFDFVSKPVRVEQLRRLADDALRLRRRTGPALSATAERLVGASEPMQDLRRMIARVARSQAPVLLYGESGTGKELVARIIHEQSARAAGPFVPVNCGAIPGELMESEFFGHRKGSFTGANADKEGLFQAADGGTLFLDEVAELPVPMQAKLLRAVQERAVRPVGASSEVSVNVRLVSATHRDLAALVSEGRFRQDLYYRLNVIELRIPPLRERREDLPALCAAILERIAAAHGLPQIPELGPDALERLAGYPFPGNVRELENVLERAVTLCESERIGAGDLLIKAEAPAAPAGEALPERLEAMEREEILRALQQTRFNKTRAAKLLGMSFRALRYRIKKLGIE